ncbi:MAG: hypothetical protein U0641_09250 [Anaerolineae bacterium]
MTPCCAWATKTRRRWCRPSTSSWRKRIIREQAPNLFDFTHDKLREVAYAELGAPQRRVLHRRVAQALEALNAEALDAVSAQIAAQYEQGGAFEQAIPYYRRAAAVAASVYANADAIMLLNRGLALLAQMPPGARRDTREQPCCSPPRSTA